MPTRTVEEILKKSNPVIIDHNKSVFDLVRLMLQSGQDAALVVNKGKTVGIVTESDLVRRVLNSEKNYKTTPVENIMTRDTVIIRPECLFGQAMYLMHEYNVRHIPVVDKGKPVGVISISDVLIPDIKSYAHDVEILDHLTEII